MIYLLRTLAKINIGDLYPVPTDRKNSAMFSRIKCIRNSTTQSVEGEFSDETFNQAWDKIGQVIIDIFINSCS